MAEDRQTEVERMRRPDPDPTAATVALVDARIAALTDLMLAKNQIVDARMDASEKAVMLIAQFPTAIDVAVGNLEKLHNLRFDAVTAIAVADREESLRYRELIAEQTRKNSTDVDAAVKAAFASSTSAVTQQNIANALASDKQGAAFTKDIEKLTVSLAQIQKNSDDKLEEVRKNNDQRVNDIKDRIAQIEARSSVPDQATQIMLRDMTSKIDRLSMGASVGDGRAQQAADQSAKMYALGALVVAIVGTAAGILWHVTVAH